MAGVLSFLRLLLVLPVIMTVAQSGWADRSVGHDASLEHDCVAPVRPADERDDVRWQDFLDAVAGFQSCISAEVDRQRAASAVHLEAARAAADEWNRFVRDSLNAPEDYPWPPE